MARASEYTTWGIIAAMKLAATDGGELSITRYEASGQLPRANAIIKRFGSWSEALVAAGLKSPSLKLDATEGQTISALQSVAINGELSIEGYKASRPKTSTSTIIRRFGTWGNALKAAGLKSPPVGGKRGLTYTNEEMVSAMRSAAVGGRLSRPLYESSACKPSSAAIINRFGSWSEGMKQAGLESFSSGPRPGGDRPANDYDRPFLPPGGS